MQKYHYVYRITNLITNKHYYGSRTTKNTPEKDLGFKYFSSSKDKSFIKDQKENPKNYKYKIIKCFESSDEKLAYEILLHYKFNVAKNSNFYNKANQTSCKFTTSGTKLSKNHKDAISKALKNKPKSLEHTQKVARSRQANFYVYNKDHQLIHTGLSSKDIFKICRSLYGKTKDNPLGQTNESKKQLKVNNNEKYIGWYTKKRGYNDTN